MQDSQNPPDLDKISAAPYDLPFLPDSTPEHLEAQLLEALEENSRLRYNNENLEADIERLLGVVDITEEKAKLIRPFSWWVFGFASVYCLIIFAIILIDGFNQKFVLDNTVLSIMAGSTAVSVLGLVSVILTGLYRSDRP